MQLKTEKTRYGSAHGRNWNLGLMLNKDNNITIGYRKKERFRAMLFQFASSSAEYLAHIGPLWSIEETQHLQGIISYYRAIEPEWVDNQIGKCQNKTGIDIKTTIKLILNPNRN